MLRRLGRVFIIPIVVATFFKLPFHWIRSAACYRLFWLAGPLLLYSWTVTGPFLSDDLHLILKSERYMRGESTSPALFRFAQTDDEWNEMRNRGTVPWWLPESGRLDFFRPASEWLIYLDLHLFGRHPLACRLSGLAVFGVALVLVHGLFRTAGRDPIRAGVATFFFGISQTVTPPVTWLSNRQDLYVVVGVAMAATAYWKARESRRAIWVVVAGLAFAFALLCKEVAVALAGVIALHEFLRPSTRRTAVVDRRDPEATRGDVLGHQETLRGPAGRLCTSMGAAAAAVVLVLSCVYLGYYLASRPWVLDVTGAAAGSPSNLGARLPVTLLLYAAVWAVGYPIDVLYDASTQQIAAVAAAGTVMMGLAIFYLRRSARDDRAALFFALWALLFILPGLRALSASTRTLCAATVGWSYLVSGLIVPTREETAACGLLYRHLIYMANGVVSIGCMIGTVLYMNSAEISARDRLRRIASQVTPALSDGDALVIAEAASPLEMICAGERLEYLTGLRDVAVNYLLPPDAQARFERVDARTLSIRSESGSLFSTPMHVLTLGAAWKPQIGQAFRLRHFSVEISEVDDDAGVKALTVCFTSPPNAGRIHYYPPHSEGDAAQLVQSAQRTSGRLLP